MGRIRKPPHPSYYSWNNMRTRCHNEKAPEYSRYGGRVIKVCERWSSFKNFLEDMGPKPSKKHSLDRIDNEGNYTPENCRWATVGEQSRNRRTNHMITFKGLTLCLKDWAAKTGMKHTTLSMRLTKYGWSVDKALTTPVRKRRGN